MKKLMSGVLVVFALGVASCGQKDRANDNVLEVPGEFPTITMAARNAKSGDTIEVNRSGTYNEASGEQFPIFIPSGVTLRKGWTRSVTIDMDGGNQLPILGVGDKVTVEGIAFRSTSGQIPAAIQSQGMSNVTIRSCIFQIRSGLVFDGARNLTIVGNTFYPWPAPGVSGAPLRRALTIWTSQDVIVKNNTFSSFTTNVLVERSVNVRIERNILMDATSNGLEVDDTSFSTMTITENDVWGNNEGMWNNTTLRPFFPATGGNIAANPLFLNREIPWDGLHESSPCVLTGGNVVGAQAVMKTDGAKPQMTKAPTSGSILVQNGASIRVMDVKLESVGTAPVQFAPGLRIWTKLSSSVANATLVLRLRDASGTILAEEDTSAPLRPGIRTLVTNHYLPFYLYPGNELDLWFEVETPTVFSAGDTIQLEVTSMEWVYGGGMGFRVNDGFSPQGLPITNAVVKP